MSDEVWDDPELGGDEPTYLKLDRIGDGIEGTITAVETKVWDDDTRCPQLTILPPDNAEDDPVVWTAGQTQAIRQLKTLRPKVGDYIKVRLDDIEKRRGGKTLKHISVDVTPGRRATPTQAEPVSTPGAGAGAPAGIDPVTWAGLPSERRAAILTGVGGQQTEEEPPF